jgi:hypothetical protein
VAYAITAFALADYQAEDGLAPDVELIKKAECLWDGVRRDSPNNPMADGALVVVRRRLAQELADHGEPDEAAQWETRSLNVAQGNPELLYLLAIEYAQSARLTGKLPTKLSSVQLDRRRRQFADGAIAILRQAVAEGFKDAGRFHREAAFEAIQSHPDFAVIRSDIEFPSQPFAGDRG